MAIKDNGKFPLKFKRDAVLLAMKYNNIRRAADELGISDRSLKAWRKQLQEEIEPALEIVSIDKIIQAKKDIQVLDDRFVAQMAHIQSLTLDHIQRELENGRDFDIKKLADVAKIMSDMRNGKTEESNDDIDRSLKMIVKQQIININGKSEQGITDTDTDNN